MCGVALVPAAVQHGRGGLLHQGADGGAHPNHQGVAPVGGDQDAAGIALGYGLRTLCSCNLAVLLGYGIDPSALVL